MPHVNLYVRQEDWEAFEAIKNKPEWLHVSILRSRMAMPTTLKEANNPKSPGYSALVRPDIVDEPHYEPVDDLP